MNKGCSGSVYNMHTLFVQTITTRLFIEEPQYLKCEKLHEMRPIFFHECDTI